MPWLGETWDPWDDLNALCHFWHSCVYTHLIPKQMVYTVAYKNLRTVQGIKPNSTSEITSPFHLSYGHEITQVIAIFDGWEVSMWRSPPYRCWLTLFAKWEALIGPLELPQNSISPLLKVDLGMFSKYWMKLALGASHKNFSFGGRPIEFDPVKSCDRAHLQHPFSCFGWITNDLERDRSPEVLL